MWVGGGVDGWVVGWVRDGRAVMGESTNKKNSRRAGCSWRLRAPVTPAG